MFQWYLIMKTHRSSLRFAFAFLFSGLVACSTLASESFSVVNPSFEDVSTEVLDGWQLHTDPDTAERANGKATVAELRQDSEFANDGSASALILHQGPRWATIRQPIHLQPGSTYRVTAFVRTESNPDLRINGNVRLFASRKGEKLITSPSETEGPVGINTDGEWRKISREYTVSDSVTSNDRISLELRAIIAEEIAEPVKIWFDTVSVKIVEPSN